MDVDNMTVEPTMKMEPLYSSSFPTQQFMQHDYSFAMCSVPQRIIIETEKQNMKLIQGSNNSRSPSAETISPQIYLCGPVISLYRDLLFHRTFVAPMAT